jgi:hypothetical protein
MDRLKHNGRNVLRMADEEFQQSCAVAQLAVKLCELKKAELKWPSERASARPEEFLEEAWNLIQRAREHVLRRATAAEIMIAGGQNDDAPKKAVHDALLPALTRAREKFANGVSGDSCEFEKGVELITKEKRPERAMRWFREFLKSRLGTEAKANDLIASFRSEGFDVRQLDILQCEFENWKPLEKSRLAKEARAKRKH